MECLVNGKKPGKGRGSAILERNKCWKIKEKG